MKIHDELPLDAYQSTLNQGLDRLNQSIEVTSKPKLMESQDLTKTPTRNKKQLHSLNYNSSEDEICIRNGGSMSPVVRGARGRSP